MGSDVKIDVREAVKTLQKEFSEMEGSKFRLAVARSLNSMASILRTRAKREAMKTYSLKRSEFKVDKYMGIGKASRNDLTAKLGVSIKPFPIYAFRPVQTEKGISVRIMGQAKTIRNAFIATMKSGHIGVFGRGGYQNIKDFNWRNTPRSNATAFRRINGKIVPVAPNDNPIEELKTASPYSMVTHSSVLESLAADLEQEFPDRLLKQLLKVQKGY